MQKDNELLKLQQRYRPAGIFIGKLPLDNKYYAVDSFSGNMLLDPMPLDEFSRAIATVSIGR